MPATVVLKCRHNLPVQNAEALSFRKIDLLVRERFNNYFDAGLSAAAASEYHVNQIDMDYDAEEAVLARADAAVNPSHNTVSYLYNLWREANLCKRNGEGMWSILQQKVDRYTAEGATVLIQREPFAVVVVTAEHSQQPLHDENNQD